MNRLGITQPLPVVRMGFSPPFCMYIFYAVKHTQFNPSAFLNAFVTELKYTVLPHISMLKTKNSSCICRHYIFLNINSEDLKHSLHIAITFLHLLS